MSRIPLLALLLATAGLSAQERQVTTSSIEVVSVNENKSGETAGAARPGGPGRFGAINMTLRMLINAAYGGIPTSRIIGGPDWADTLRFDVDGIGDPAQSSSALLQAALRDRFALKVRRESQQLDVYALVVARPNGNLRPGLRRRNDCSAAEAQEKHAAPQQVFSLQDDGGELRANQSERHFAQHARREPSVWPSCVRPNCVNRLLRC